VSAPSSGPITTLVGLYEGGSSQLPHQMCVVDRKGEQRFGLIVWGTGDHNCAGSGTVTRSGDRLRLAMAGDSQCSIEATISGSTVKLPASVQEGCAYYCGKRASFGGAELTQKGQDQGGCDAGEGLVGIPYAKARAAEPLPPCRSAAAVLTMPDPLSKGTAPWRVRSPACPTPA
jgi:hypothetical protein